MGASEIAVHMLEGKDDFLMLRIGKNISVATMPAITEAALQLPVEEFVERYIKIGRAHV